MRVRKVKVCCLARTKRPARIGPETPRPWTSDTNCCLMTCPRMEWNFQKSVEIMPCLAEAGVKRIINGPMIFSPDLGPLIGPPS